MRRTLVSRRRRIVPRKALPAALSVEHLARVQELFLNVRKLRVDMDAASSDPVAVSRENIRRTKLLLLDIKKARRHPRMQRVHEDSHAKRMALEKEWQATLRVLSTHLVNAFDIEGACQAAHRGWISPPPEPDDGVFVNPTVGKSFFRRVQKKLSPPKPSDMDVISKWQGERGSAARLALQAGEQAGNEVYVLRNAAGDPIAVAAVTKTPKELHINVLAAAQGEGNGTRMMQELAQTAKADGLGIGLFSVPNARGFYEGIGMSAGDRTGQYSMTPEQVAAFAVTGGTYAPAGVPQAGLTRAESAGAQQLALNVIAGVPAGASATAQDVKRALVAHVNEAGWTSGATTAYLGLATKTAEQAGQVSLDHLGLNKTFAFANPENMAQDTYAARGSKVIANMYGAHTNALTKIITDATDPRSPKTIAQVKAAINEQWPDLQDYQVERIARTETAAVWTTTAVNAYAANGISQFESIVATGPSIGVQTEDPCDECVDAASEVHSIDDDLPPWHPNAVFEGSTFLPYGRVEEMVRGFYCGPAISIRAGDHNFTIGPNHPMLTARGMVKAQHLREGDQLVYDFRTQRYGGESAIESDIEDVPFVEDAFAALLSACGDSWVAPSTHNFHGDVVCVKGEVDVVRPDGHLLPELQHGFSKNVSHPNFYAPDPELSILARSGSRAQRFIRVSLSPSRRMSGSYEGGSLTIRHTLVAPTVRLSDQFAFVRISHIKETTFEGWAFDATTEHGLFNSSGFIVSNCRCEAIPVLEDTDGTPWLPPDEPWTGGGDNSGPALADLRPVPSLDSE